MGRGVAERTGKGARRGVAKGWPRPSARGVAEGRAKGQANGQTNGWQRGKQSGSRGAERGNRKARGGATHRVGGGPFRCPAMNRWGGFRLVWRTFGARAWRTCAETKTGQDEKHALTCSNAVVPPAGCPRAAGAARFRCVASLLACCAGKRFAFPQLRTLSGSNPGLWIAKSPLPNWQRAFQFKWCPQRDSNP